MLKNVTPIKSGMKIKMQNNLMYAKKFIFRIMLHVVVKMVNMYEITFMIK